MTGMGADRVNDLRYALGKAEAPPMPASSPNSHREPIATVEGGPIDADELDTVSIALITEADPAGPPLVMISVWDATSSVSATAVLRLRGAIRVEHAVNDAVAMGLLTVGPDELETLCDLEWDARPRSDHRRDPGRGRSDRERLAGLEDVIEGALIGAIEGEANSSRDLAAAATRAARDWFAGGLVCQGDVTEPGRQTKERPES